MTGVNDDPFEAGHGGDLTEAIPDEAGTGPDDDVPPGYVRFDRVRAALPDPERVRVREGLALETLQLSGRGPAVVFVHGGLGSLWNPYPQLSALDGDRSVVSYSLAGNRGSDRRADETLAGHVADLRGLVEALDVEAPVVHGHSYGSTVAIEYARRHPVSGLVVAGGGAYGLTNPFERPALALVRALRLYRLPAPTWLFARLVAGACHPETPRAVAADFARANPLPRRRSAYAVPTAFRGYDGRDGLDDIEAPALVVNGVADEVVPPEVGRETASRLPNGRFHRLAGAGHLPFVERPAAYGRLLSALLSRSDRVATRDR